MSTQQSNDQTLNVETLSELLHYAMVGIAFTLKDVQTTIAAQQLFGKEHAVLDIYSFNPLKAPSANYQEEHERLVARAKQFKELLEHAKNLRTQKDVEAFVKSRMSAI
jgi:hypothetical protein